MLYESNYYGTVYLGDTLTHHGIKGQKWGIRRFQNPDGTLTALGKQRYGTVANFNRAQQAKISSGVSGARATALASLGIAAATGNYNNFVKKTAISSALGGAVSAALTDRQYRIDKNKGKKQLSPEELAQKRAARKEMAKKIAKGVAIGAAVAGTAYIAHKAVREINAEKHDLQNTLRKLDMNLQIEKDPIHALSSYDPRARDVAKSTPLAGRSVKKMSIGDLKRTIDETKIAAQKQEIHARAERKNEEARRQIAREMMANTPYKFTAADAKKWDTMFSKTSIDDLRKKNKSLFNSSIDSILKDMPRTYANMTMDDLRKLDLY